MLPNNGDQPQVPAALMYPQLAALLAAIQGGGQQTPMSHPLINLAPPSGMSPGGPMIPAAPGGLSPLAAAAAGLAADQPLRGIPNGSPSPMRFHFPGLPAGRQARPDLSRLAAMFQQRQHLGMREP